MPRPLRAGERAPACGDVCEMVDAGCCAGRRARRARCCGCMAMWRVCDAERWIGDGVVDEYSVLSLSKTRTFEAHRDIGLLRIRGLIAAQFDGGVLAAWQSADAE